jgi:hypothetical protein
VSTEPVVRCGQRTLPHQCGLHLFNSIVARQKRNDVSKFRLFPRFVFTGKTGKCNGTKPWDPSWYGRVNWLESGRDIYRYQQSITYTIKFFERRADVGSMALYAIFRRNGNVSVGD